MVEILDQAEEGLRKGTSLKKQGFLRNDHIGFQEVKDRVKRADPNLKDKVDWEKIFIRVIQDHPNVGFTKGLEGFEF